MLVDRLLSPAVDDILDVEYTRNLERSGQDEEGTRTTPRRWHFYKKFERTERREGMINLKEAWSPTPRSWAKVRKAVVIRPQVRPVPRLQRVPGLREPRELETPEPGADGDSIEEACENCGKPMAMKRGRFGMFLACTGYPECKTTRKIITTKQGMTAAKPDQILDEKCPKCDSNLVIKQGRFGEFTACTNYPACKYVKQKSTGLVCPQD